MREFWSLGKNYLRFYEIWHLHLALTWVSYVGLCSVGRQVAWWSVRPQGQTDSQFREHLERQAM